MRAERSCGVRQTNKAIKKEERKAPKPTSKAPKSTPKAPKSTPKAAKSTADIMTKIQRSMGVIAPIKTAAASTPKGTIVEPNGDVGGYKNRKPLTETNNNGRLSTRTDSFDSSRQFCSNQARSHTGEDPHRTSTAPPNGYHPPNNFWIPPSGFIHHLWEGNQWIEYWHACNMYNQHAHYLESAYREQKTLDQFLLPPPPPPSHSFPPPPPEEEEERKPIDERIMEILGATC